MSPAKFPEYYAQKQLAAMLKMPIALGLENGPWFPRANDIILRFFFRAVKMDVLYCRKKPWYVHKTYTQSRKLVQHQTLLAHDVQVSIVLC